MPQLFSNKIRQFVKLWSRTTFGHINNLKVLKWFKCRLFYATIRRQRRHQLHFLCINIKKIVIFFFQNLWKFIILGKFLFWFFMMNPAKQCWKDFPGILQQGKQWSPDKNINGCRLHSSIFGKKTPLWINLISKMYLEVLEAIT